MTNTTGIIAVSAKETAEFGCPYCGYRSGTQSLSGGGAAVWNCGDSKCGKTSILLAEGVSRSPISLNGVHPELQPHPRHGIPSHGTPDKRPDGGGEFFSSRGLGLDHRTIHCFVCGTEDRDGKGHYVLNNISAYVRCKESGERVVGMFKQGAWLDYRDFEPDYVQVKVGACDQHKPNLKRLDGLVRDGIITSERIAEALAA